MGRGSSESDEDRARRRRDRRSPDQRHSRGSVKYKSRSSRRSRSSSRSRHRRRRSRSRDKRRPRRDRRRSHSGGRRRRHRSSSSSSSERGGSSRPSKHSSAPTSKPCSPSPPAAPVVALKSDDPVDRADAIAAIEDDGFVQHSFLSGKGRISGGGTDNGLSAVEKETLASMAAGPVGGSADAKQESIAHPKLSEGIAEKTDLWVKKIFAMRQKLRASGSGVV